jgi:D-alanine-D-alanine ligase-like ATP-grasp enzyme
VSVTVVYESWRPHPLAWIHRAEARSIAGELRRSGLAVELARWRENAAPSLPPGALLLRLSDSLMLSCAQALGRASVPFLGPHAAVMERCYDKHVSHRIATANGVDCPATALASDAGALPFPLVLKPRRGSDSIGVQLLRGATIPAARRSEHYLVQEYVRGTELTVGVINGRTGMPLRIDLPADTLHSFRRKYLVRAPRTPLTDAGLIRQVRQTALRVARLFEVNWAARIDLIHESDTGRLRFLECDVAPLVSAGSTFAASLEAGGIGRAEQLRLLLNNE